MQNKTKRTTKLKREQKATLARAITLFGTYDMAGTVHPGAAHANLPTGTLVTVQIVSDIPGRCFVRTTGGGVIDKLFGGWVSAEDLEVRS